MTSKTNYRAGRLKPATSGQISILDRNESVSMSLNYTLTRGLSIIFFTTIHKRTQLDTAWSAGFRPRREAGYSHQRAGLWIGVLRRPNVLAGVPTFARRSQTSD